MVQQQAYFPIRVGGNNASNAIEVLPIHEYQVIEVVIVGSSHLPCSMFRTMYAVSLKGSECHGVDWIPDFFAACRSGINFQ